MNRNQPEGENNPYAPSPEAPIAQLVKGNITVPKEYHESFLHGTTMKGRGLATPGQLIWVHVGDTKYVAKVISEGIDGDIFWYTFKYVPEIPGTVSEEE